MQALRIGRTNLCLQMSEGLRDSSESLPFEKPPFWNELESSVASGFHTALMGPGGTGKTTAVKQLASRNNRRLHIIQVHADLTIEELRGEPGLRDGNSTFQPSPLVEAVKNGDWILLEEANLARPGITAWLNNILDDDGVLSIPATVAFPRSMYHSE